jgi:hypothetical protein
MHRTKRSRTAVVASIAAAVIVLVAAIAVVMTIREQHRRPPAPIELGSPAPTPPPVATRPPGLVQLAENHPVKLPDGVFAAWSLANAAGPVAGSANHASEQSSTESVIKVWIAADDLRQHPKPKPDRLDLLTRMITLSDDQATQHVYLENGGLAVIERMIKTCGLVGTSVVPGWWSRTRVTADDAARIGTCVADGRAAGGGWTPWILDRMREVTGDGRFGAVDVFPEAGFAIKNGWTPYDNEWHVACLTIGPGWVLATLVRYPFTEGLSYGAAVCASVTRQLAAPPDGAA